jgi:hypothetical protein
MGGLNHDFFLLSLEEHPYTDYHRFYNRSDALLVHDDILQYLADTLRWIPTINAARGVPHDGLCWYGPTAITETGAGQARRIFQAWADLFEVGPEVVRLTGAWSWQVRNEPEQDGYTIVESGTEGYEQLIVPRSGLVQTLRTLAEWAERVRQSGGDHYILHLGI